MRPRVEIVLEQIGVGADEPRRLREIARRQLRLAQQRLALGLAVNLRQLARFVDEGGDVLHEGGIDHPFDRDGRDERGDQRRDRRHQREQRDDAVMQSRAGARGAARGAQAAQLDADQHQQPDDDEPVAAEQRQHDLVGRDDRREAGEDDEGRERQDQRAADRDRAEHPGNPALVEPRAFRRRSVRAGLLLRLMNRHVANVRRRYALRPSPELRNCNSVARLRQNGGETHLNPRTPRRSRSRIFLRSVLRLRPRISAALIWLPRVADSVAAISGASRSRRTR